MVGGQPLRMELTLRIEEDGSGRVEERAVDVAPGTEIAELLRGQDINPQTVLVERDGQIVTKKDTVTEDDTALTVLDVISGG
jgi:sulfur carrier protein ThiS